MANTTYGKTGIARTYALIFGIAYIAVAVLEDVLGGKGLRIGDTLILRVTAVQNLIHWVVGVAVLGSFFAGEVAAKMVARVVGIVFVVVTLLGFLARTFTGKLLGFHGPLPWSYNIVHLATAIFALIAGFAVSRLYRGSGAPSADPVA
jgi:Domain of unknown function (DUF4383)